MKISTIVISGDHHTMDVDFCEDIDEDYVRRVYTAVINPAAEVADASVQSGILRPSICFQQHWPVLEFKFRETD